MGQFPRQYSPPPTDGYVVRNHYSLYVLKPLLVNRSICHILLVQSILDHSRLWFPLPFVDRLDALTYTVRSLLGVIKGTDVEDYHRYLEEKYH